MATDQPVSGVGPPASLLLKSIRLDVHQQAGRGLVHLSRRVTLSGEGQATLELGGQTLPFDCTPTQLLAWLDTLYALRFFDLPRDYSTQYSAVLKKDGTVVPSMQRMLDASSTEVCVRAGDFKRCVRFGEAGPQELKALAQRILDDANRLSKAPGVPATSAAPAAPVAPGKP